jgi:hypothetical protein
MMASSASSYSNLTPEQERIRRIQEGISNMRMPTTTDVVQSIEHMKSSPIHSQIDENVSPTGKRIHEDIVNLSTATQKFITEKNKNDLLQNMINHANNARKLTQEELTKISATGEDYSEVRRNLTFTYSKLISVVKMLISSTEFRSLIKIFIGILMDIFKFNMKGDTAKMQTMDKISGDSSGRMIGHEIVDIIADTTKNMIPSEQNEIKLRGSKMKSYIKEKTNQIEIPNEYKQELINRLKMNLEQFQKRPEYQQALEELLTGIDNLTKSTQNYKKNKMESGSSAFKESKADIEWSEAIKYARLLLENLFNRNLQSVIDTWQVLYNDMMNDKLLFTWFQGWLDFIKAMLRDSNYVQSDQFKEDARVLSTETPQVLKDKYREYAMNLHSELSNFLSGITDDPMTTEFIDELRILWEDLFLDDNGNLTIKSELLDDFMKIIPELADKMLYLPVPKYEKDAADYYVMMDQIVMNCKGLVPTYIKFGTNGTIDLSTPPRVDALLSLNVSHIYVSAQNVAFAFQKKSGWWKFGDSGRLDFELDNNGTGLSVDLKFKPWVQRSSNGTTKGLDLVLCKVNLNKIHIRLHDMEKHNLRYKIFRPIIENQVRKQLSRILSDSLRKIIDQHATNDDTNVVNPIPSSNGTNNNVASSGAIASPSSTVSGSGGFMSRLKKNQFFSTSGSPVVQN